jgi:hypothetical protein
VNRALVVCGPVTLTLLFFALISLFFAAGRFSKFDGNTSSSLDDVADVASCLFHLCEASLLGSCAAALALGRLRSGLGTDLLEVLGDYVAEDRVAAVSFYQLAAARGSVMGAWQAAQISATDGGEGNDACNAMH